jgi:DNA-directed RNA polymerase beta' subunit
VLVNNEGLAIRSLLKIQSDPFGNLRDLSFDGDEMNLHMPQDPESEAELRYLAAVPYNIISPANNKSIIGIYQDSMLGCYQFTREKEYTRGSINVKEGIRFEPRDAMNLLMMFDGVNEHKLLENAEKESGITNFDIISQIMPPLSLKYKTKSFKDDKDEFSSSNKVLEIKNGKYIRGQMDKGVLADGTKGLLHRTCNDFGNMVSAKFIDDLQNVITEYMKSSSFSVGISDLISDEKTKSEIIEVITRKKTDVKNLIDQVQIGIFENNTGKTNEAEFETQVNNILNKATDESGKIGREKLSKTNGFVTMVNSGSKGSDLNISFMISCLGQQNVDGKRIPYGFEHRTLPHFTKYDDSPGARGFVESSYINGLSPQELFFHAMGGRVGLIDTAVKTSTTGYIQRKLIKGLEDLMVNYDMTVRTNKGKIVQFSYGEDNIDTTKVETQNLPIVNMSTQDIFDHFIIPDEPGKNKTLSHIFLKNTMSRYKKQLPEMLEYCSKYTDMMIKMRTVIIKKVFGNKGDSGISCPVAFSYVIGNIQGQTNITSSSLVDITPVEAFELIERTYENLLKIHYAPPTELFKTLYYYYLSPKDLLIIKRFNKNSLIILLDTITLDYKRSIVTPGEMVGMIAGQSIGEVSTQMTLNSVTYETHIIVRNREGIIQKIQIGDFIENKIKIATKTEYYKDNDTTYSEVDDYYEIPSCTEDGEMLWKRIEAVTRHPVINTDGTNTMLKITTKEQREVIVTKAKGILKLINGKIIGITGDELKVGDYLPVSKMTLEFSETTMLNLKTILLPTEYVYSSEVEKAKAVMNEHHWWSKHNGNTFVLPYKRSDSFVAKVSENLRNGCKTKTTFAPNCVYTLQTNKNDYQIPENIPLDYNLGYLIGAYAAEGCMTRFQISISNNENSYFAPILKFCEKYNLTTKIYRHEDKNQKGWTSQDIRIYSTVLCRLLEHFCGKLSHNKFVSNEIIFSNKECLLGFMDAYIGGDGCVNTNNHSPDIFMSSVSKELLMDVQQILNIFGCYSKINKPKKMETNNRGSQDIKQIYNLFVRNMQAQKLASMLNIKIDYKQENLKKILVHKYKYDYCQSDTVVPNEVDGKIVMTPRDAMTNCFDTYFDKVISIEEVSNTTNYAYDLTISDTRNFNIYNGLAQKDTFHFAGVASKSNVTRGVPRIEEILSLSENPKNPSLTIFLKQEDETQKDKAQSIMYMLEHTKLEEVVKSVEICFDPDNLSSLIEEDNNTIEQFKAFENMIDECIESSLTNDENEKSKWIIRMVMDPVVMLEKNITMDDVNFTLKNAYDSQITCVFSDFNSDKLVFRIRMNEVIKTSSSRSAQKKIKVNPLDQSDHIYILKNFQDQLLQNVVLRGIKGIDKVILRKIKDTVFEKNGIYKKEDIWVLDTVGTNILDVLALDYIDNTRVVSNDIVEVFNVLGIEAARQTILNELVEVISYDGTYINYHNYCVLCDRMTATSKLISISRHGINNDNIGPIAKASFEETPEMFLRAAKHAELDNMRGVSANVMCGQEGFFGTSLFQVVLNIEEMMELEAVSEYKPVDDSVEIENFFGQVENPLDVCSKDNLLIQNNVSNIKTIDMGDDNNYNPGF